MSSSSAELAIGPDPALRFHRRLQPVLALRELWRVRAVVLSLAEREVRARYKQAMLGLAWAVLTPLALMGVFTLFFQRVARLDTSGIPYPLFAFLGLIPWAFFSTSVSHGGLSLLHNVLLLNKVYCPREVFPLAGILVAALDAAIATVAFAGLLGIYTVAPKITALWIPVLLAVQVAFTTGCTLIVSSVIVYLRDLRHVVPIVLQLGLFATPVAYGIDIIPASWRGVYAVLNPLAPVIDGYRRTIVLGKAPDLELLGLGAAGALVLLVGGYVIFKKLETGFADVA